MTRATRQTRRTPSSVPVDGERIRRMRWERGLTLKGLAELCGIGFTYVSNIETGRNTRVSPTVFAKICEALGVTDPQALMHPRDRRRNARLLGDSDSRADPDSMAAA